MMIAEATHRTVKKLSMFAVAMFCFGVFAMPPLYDVLCDLTGVNVKIDPMPKTNNIGLIDPNRLVTVEFDTNVNKTLPWMFKAAEYKKKVHPGEMAEIVFIAENKSDKAISGQAIPSVAPSQAAAFFNKTECFCFAQQVLAPNERKEMIVRFVVDSKLPKKIKTITLSYTFFEAITSDNTNLTSVDIVEVVNKI